MEADKSNNQQRQQKHQQENQTKQQQKGKNQEGAGKSDEEDQIDISQIKSLQEGKEKGLSKNQMKKLEKRLKVEAKKSKKEQKALVQQRPKQLQQKKKQDKPGKKQDQLSPEYLKEFESQKIKVIPNKKLPQKQQNNVLITSALPYVNNVPHLGNIIGCVLSADVYARFMRLHGSNVLYICGTDQYGTATEVKAIQEKKTPKQICDYYNKIHAEVYEWFDIGFDHFGRTSTEWHSKVTQQIFLDVLSQGRISQQQMTQCYCENCDLFLADKFVVGTCPHPECAYQDARGDQCDKCQKLFNSPTEMINYSCKICKKQPLQKKTTHFFINLSEIQPELQKWVQYSSVKGQWSANSIATTKSWTNMGLKPKCITRDLKWGVPVPIQQFKNKVFYVWFDAPIGYISITATFLGEDYKKWWQDQQNVKLYQFMGKDNIPFHTVIFPSSLIASKKPWTLLHHISTTEYLNYQSAKFSKSRGVGVFGDNAKTTGIPCQVWRYYLLVNRPQKSDSQFHWKDFVQRNNSELLANVGNLCLRVLKFCYSSYNKQIPKVKADELLPVDHDFLKLIQQKYAIYIKQLEAVQIKEGLKIAMEISSIGNKFVQDSKFWEKQNKQSERSIIVTGIICNFIRFLSLLLEPYIPSTSAKINFLLGIERTEEDEVLGKSLKEVLLKQGFTNKFLELTGRSKGLNQPAPLFNKYTEEQAQEWRQKFAGGQKKQGVQQKA